LFVCPFVFLVAHTSRKSHRGSGKISRKTQQNRRKKDAAVGVRLVVVVVEKQFKAHTVGKCEMQNAKMELELEPVEPGEQKPPEHTCPTKLLESD